MEFFLNKEKDQVMKTKEKRCQKRLFRILQVLVLRTEYYALKIDDHNITALSQVEDL